MTQKIILVLCLFVSVPLFAQKYVELKLWPEGAPNSNGITTPEVYPRNDRIANVSDPTLMVYPAARPNGLSVIACPGGAYHFLSMGQEGHMMAQWFNALGITYAVLKYRMPNQGHHDIPLSDVEQAIRLLHTHAEQWEITQIGVLGSSAGGHLASTAATHLKGENAPDFQILLYPVITMDEEYTHEGTRKELLGNAPNEEQVWLYSNEKQVTAQTPPAFILHCTDDTTVPVRNSIAYFLALQQHHIPTSMHIYPNGGHGFGFYDHFKYKAQWTLELEKWLNEVVMRRNKSLKK